MVKKTRFPSSNKDQTKVLDKYDEVFNITPASVLRDSSEPPIKRSRKKNARNSDGFGAVHLLLKEQVEQELMKQQLSLPLKGKRRRQRSSSSSTSTTQKKSLNGQKSLQKQKIVDLNENIFESMLNGKTQASNKVAATDKESAKCQKVEPVKNPSKINSASSGLLNKLTFPDHSEESSLSDVCIDFEQLAENQNDIFGKSSNDKMFDLDSDEGSEETLNTEVELSEEGEDEDMLDDEEDSFIVSDEEKLDSIEDESEEESEDNETETSVNEKVELEIIGFKTLQATPDCVVLQKEDTSSPLIALKTFKLFMFSEENSVQSGLNALGWLINPVDVQTFFSEIFQKRALVIKRGTEKKQGSQYFKDFFTTSDFVTMLQNHYLEYNSNVNMASYKAGVRTTHNGSNRVYARVLQDHLQQGHSAQCVNPQTFNDNIWYLCEILQEVFCSFVGANNYLTPANSAGFAPHWDDVDAFMLQTEGRKHWKVFAPETPDDALPISSSVNFTDADFEDREAVFDDWLEEGDLLYIPRGFVHQAKTDAKVHSHHVTVSVCKNFTFSTLLETGLAQYLQNMVQSCRQLRTSLPPLILDMAGAADLVYASDELLAKKVEIPCENFLKKIARSFSQFLPALIDSTSQDYMQTALPPMLSSFEREHSCVGGPNLDVFSKFDLEHVKIRFIRKHTQRLVYASEESTFIVHRMQNSRVYSGRPEVTLDYPFELEKGFIALADAYPKWVGLGELGLAEQKAADLVKLLYQNCLLLVQSPKKHMEKKKETPRNTPKIVVVKNIAGQNNRMEMSKQHVVDFTKSSSKKNKKKNYWKKGKKFSQ